MTDYIMQNEAEAERIRLKTDLLLVRHHLDWAGLKPGQSFADFGCASGEVLREAARIGAPAEAVGVDGDAGTIAFARAESDRQGLSNVRYVQARVGGEGSTPLPAETFDHAWARFFVEYVKDPLGCVREMRRVVKPGGRVTLIDLDGNCIWHYPFPAKMQASAGRGRRPISRPQGSTRTSAASFPTWLAAPASRTFANRSSRTTRSWAGRTKRPRRRGASSSTTSGTTTAPPCSRRRRQSRPFSTTCWSSFFGTTR